MSLIQFKSISKRYGPEVIFDEANALLSKGDKVGVIGRNGAGKTTLCRFLLAEEDLDAGEIACSPQLRLGYLEQKDPYEAHEPVLEFLQRYTGKEAWRCGKVAGRFQLKGPLLEERIGALPGGYQTRVKLAAMLLGEPNFLVLDEPSNYLDLRTLVILEHWLREFLGGFLIVSHDREFLKRTCEKTLEVEQGQLRLFPGDVEAYLAYKEEERQQRLRYNRNVEAKRKHLKGFVDRYRVRAATASRAQSKLKQLQRLQTIEVEHPIRTARIRIPRVEEKKGVALTLDDLAIGYPGNAVADGIRFDIERGQRVAVLGDNGEGKTTFLRSVAGQLQPVSGGYRWGAGLDASYYAQHVYSQLNPEQRIISYLEQEADREASRQEILDMAGSFLFQGDAVEKPVAVLSGGERARLCLAGILLAKRSVLLLDEPTNHLDIETVEALAGALRSFQGTILFTCHDRTFVKLVATSIVEVKDGAVNLYPGDYDTYVYRVEQEVASAGESTARDERAPASRAASEHELRKARRSRIRKVRTRLGQVDALVARYEREREDINRYYLENPTAYSKEKQTRLEELRSLLAAEEQRWLELQQELDELERQEN